MILKRSKLDIYIEILKVMSKGTCKPTRIMYETNLSWAPLMKILRSMLTQDLIRKNENDAHLTYEITDKGEETLEYFKKAMELIEVR